MNGAELIAEERRRQIEEEGWDAGHDDEHTDESIAMAAAWYALPLRSTERQYAWPKSWSQDWCKPTPDNRVRELAKAGALIAAEIDRLLRKDPPTTKGRGVSGRR